VVEEIDTSEDVSSWGISSNPLGDAISIKKDPAGPFLWICLSQGPDENPGALQYPQIQLNAQAPRTHRVLLMIDQYTCRIIGLAVHTGPVDGIGTGNWEI